MLTDKDREFLLRLADLCEEHKAALGYTNSDDGIHVELAGREVFCGWFFEETGPKELRAAAEAIAGALVAGGAMRSTKTRKEAAALANRQLQDSPNREGKTILDGRPKARANHYGKQEIRELLDFIYGGPPESDDECVA